MLDVLKVIILGIVEGITEWLPVSSTGHLILVGDRQDQAPDGGTGSAMRKFRQ